MFITIETLIDITETLVRKGPEIKKVKQQNNHDTFLQACSLRSNIEFISCESKVEDVNFGSANSGKNRCWKLTVKTDFPFSEEMLIDDLDYLPILIDLDETGLVHNSIVQTKDSVYKNTIFTLDDK